MIYAGVGAPKVVINVHQTYILNRTLNVHNVHKRTHYINKRTS